ncbi:hypothetical protein JHK82_012929 [Glycine max]|nr:hypothetical protein JHK85_013290 [Glycine max]KAG5154960.1 hypothetical protein JHK82_012929 [Glycine max]
MTFQSALNPLGEVRPGNESGVVQCPVNKADNNPCPGESILAVVYPDEYEPHLEHNMFHFIFSSVSLACRWVPSQTQILHLGFVNRDVHHHLQPHSYLHREVQLVSCITKNEEEKVSLEKEIKILLYLVKETEQEANAKREEKAQLKEKLKEVEAEAIQLQEALKDTTAGNMKLKDNL